MSHNELPATAILFDETIRQSASDGMRFPDLLAGSGIIPGAKVDQALCQEAGLVPIVARGRAPISPQQEDLIDGEHNR